MTKRKNTKSIANKAYSQGTPFGNKLAPGSISAIGIGKRTWNSLSQLCYLLGDQSDEVTTSKTMGRIKIWVGIG